MRSKHITAYRIPGLAKIDGDLVFPLCVEEGGGYRVPPTEPNSFCFADTCSIPYIYEQDV